MNDKKTQWLIVYLDEDASSDLEWTKDKEEAESIIDTLVKTRRVDPELLGSILLSPI